MICTLSKHAAEAKGFGDALMLDYRGYLAETTGANLFLVINGEIHTPTPDCFLNGITRRAVIGLARSARLQRARAAHHARRAARRAGDLRHRHGGRGDPGTRDRRAALPGGPRHLAAHGGLPGRDAEGGLHLPEPGQSIAVCVFCGSRYGLRPSYREAATALGRGIAQRGWRLVYGGGDVGLMSTVADATLAGGGLVQGVIPRRLLDREVGKREVDNLVVTGTMAERKDRMIADSDAFVSLAGGLGTLDELLEVMTLRQLGYLDKPILLVDTDGYWQPFMRLVEQVVGEGFAERDSFGLAELAPTADEALERVAALVAVGTR